MAHMTMDVTTHHDSGSRGFLLHVFHRQQGARFAVVAIGRLESHETFEIVDDREAPAFHFRRSDLNAARQLTGAEKMTFATTDRTTMDGEAAVQVSGASLANLKRFSRTMQNNGLRTYEADISPARKFLMDRGLRGTVLIRGDWCPGNGVGRIYRNPELEPADWEPQLAVLALDIETDRRATEVHAVSLAGTGPQSKHHTEELHLVGDRREDDPPGVTCYPDEPALLEGFARRVAEIDPDVLTGWNVIDFDLSVLHRRIKAHGRSLSLGRTRDGSWYREGENWGGSRMTIHGRQVVDALRLVLAIPKRFDDYRLGTVAHEVLGRTKTLEADEERAMPEVIERAYRSDRAAFCAYCLENSRLVRDILAATRIMDITLRRSLLTGLPLEGAWGSVAAFDFLYISGLHRRRIVAPTLGTDRPDGGGAPGGLVLSPHPGLHRGVFVFDFKSLYPSIIRTFNIDPWAHVRAERSGGGAEVITAPNGAAFVRAQGILPAILERFFTSRDRAKTEGDDLASFTYKNVMNAFYGVLTTGACRFASPRLGGAITQFGHYILRWTRDLLESEGSRVLYGDTDSLFVDAHLTEGADVAEAFARGRRLCDRVNRKLAEHIADRYGVESCLELEFEKCYRRFLLPVSRGNEERARAKGYAGLRVGPDGETLDIIGMEAVRRDWTDLAHGLQRELLDRLFHDAPPGEIERCVARWIDAVRRGAKDRDLIYRKSLRKDISEYTRSSPPHVKAARLLKGIGRGRGVIRYVMTTQGPQPVGHTTAPLDYEHYVEKQIRPIARTIAHVSDINLDSVMTGQPYLFDI